MAGTVHCKSLISGLQVENRSEGGSDGHSHCAAEECKLTMVMMLETDRKGCLQELFWRKVHQPWDVMDGEGGAQHNS